MIANLVQTQVAVYSDLKFWQLPLSLQERLAPRWALYRRAVHAWHWGRDNARDSHAARPWAPNLEYDWNGIEVPF